MHDTPPHLRGAGDTSVPRNDVVRLMRGYDEAYVDGRGVARGGVVKQAFFTSDVLSRLEFSGRPGLDALVEDLAASLKVRYKKGPTPRDIECLKRQEAFVAKYPDIQDRDVLIFVRDGLPAYTYPIRVGHLTARHWVVDTIRKHLGTGSWPHDEATPQLVVPKTGYKRTIRRYS
jgi:hypothetical protein